MITKEELREDVLLELEFIAGKGSVLQVGHRKGAERRHLLALGLLESEQHIDPSSGVNVMTIKITPKGIALLNPEQKALPRPDPSVPFIKG